MTGGCRKVRAVRYITAMNEAVCKHCERYEAQPGKRTWLCAKCVRWKPSDFVPGHSVLHRDFLQPMSTGRELPPEWCPYKLEHVVVESDDDVPESGPSERIRWDGNDWAEARSKHGR